LTHRQSTEARPLQYLWQENGPLIDTLQEVFDPLAIKLAQAIGHKAVNHDVVGSWSEWCYDSITSGLPFGEDIYSDPYRQLPASFFGFGTDMRDICLPQSRTQKKQAVNTFLHEHSRRLNSCRSFFSMDKEFMSTVLPQELDELSRKKAIIDPLVWRKYAAIGQRQLESAPTYHIESAWNFRNSNVNSILDDPIRIDLLRIVATGRHATYNYRRTSTLLLSDDIIRSSPTGYIFMPTGEYGETWTNKLISTAVYGIEYADKILCGNIPSLSTHQEAVLNDHTARAREKDEERPTSENAIIAATQEGVATILQVMNLLTAEKIDGFDDPVTLLQAIQREQLVEEFSRAIPMGTIGPFTFSGVYIKNLVEKTETGLRLNPDIMASLRHAKKQQALTVLGVWKKYHAASEKGKEAFIPSVKGLICPVSRPHGGIAHLSDALTQALVSIDTKPTGWKTDEYRHSS